MVIYYTITDNLFFIFNDSNSITVKVSNFLLNFRKHCYLSTGTDLAVGDGKGRDISTPFGSVIYYYVFIYLIYNSYNLNSINLKYK